MAQKHLKNVRKCADRLEHARAELGDAILAAYQSGETIADIVPWCGLSRSRVYELWNDAKARQLEE